MDAQADAIVNASKNAATGFQLFGMSTETLVILLLVALIIIILLVRKNSGGAIALAASVPLFWLLSKKLGKGEDELTSIQQDYDQKLAKLQHEFNEKIESLKQTLQTDLQQHELRAETIHTDIQALDARAKEQVKNASPDELEAIARAVLTIPKK
ncbi:hypothetical protein JW960_29315 [candidate division KSB1 bacterium]|nr:hypothetical protein [candidate division KSB1 bacterium]